MKPQVCSIKWAMYRKSPEIARKLPENYVSVSGRKSASVKKSYTVKIEVQQNSYLAHDFERSEKE